MLFVDEAEADGLRARHHRHGADANNFQIAALNLTPERRARGAGQLDPFRKSPAEAIRSNARTLVIVSNVGHSSHPLFKMAQIVSSGDGPA